MKEPVPVHREAPAKAKPAAARSRDGRRPAAGDRSATVRVRCYGRMKPQRVYPLIVEVPPAGAARPAANMPCTPVVVRPVIPGAVVTPAEQRLDLSHPNASVTFQVTPLARGWLRGARVDIAHDAQILQSIPLKIKGATQRLTWVLVALAVVLPWLLVKYTRYTPPTGDLPVVMKRPDLGQNPNGKKGDAKQEDGKQEDGKAGQPGKGKRRPDNGKGKQEPDNGKQPGAGEDEKREQIPPPRPEGEGDQAQPVLFFNQDDQPPPPPQQPPKDGFPGKGGFPGMPPGGMPGKGGFPGMPPGGMPGKGGFPGMPPGGPPVPMQPAGAPGGTTPDVPETRPMPAQPWDLFKNGMRSFVHENTPEVPYLTDWIANKDYGSHFYRSKDPETGEEKVDDLAAVLAIGYKWVHLLSTDANLPFYLCAGLFGLAVVSWARHRPYRTSYRRAVPLPSAPGSGQAAETLPLGPTDEPPTLQPVD